MPDFQHTASEIVGPRSENPAERVEADQRHGGAAMTMWQDRRRRRNGYLLDTAPKYGGQSTVTWNADGSMTSVAPHDPVHARPVRWAEGELIDVETGQVLADA